MRLLLILLFLGALLGGFPSYGDAQTAEGTIETPVLMIERWEAESTLIERILAGDPTESGEIEGIRAILEDQRSAIPNLIEKIEAELWPLKEQLDALGPAPEDSPGDGGKVAEERNRLTERVITLQAKLKRLGQAEARTAALLSTSTELRKKLFKRLLLTRGPSLFQGAGMAGKAIESIRQVIRSIRDETASRIAQSLEITPLIFRVLLMWLQIGFALFLAISVKRVALGLLIRKSKTDVTRTSHVMIAVGLTLVRLLIPSIGLAMAFVAVRSSGFLGPLGQDALQGLALATAIVVGAYAIGGIFFSPHAPQLRLSKLSEAESITVHRWLMALAAVIGADRAFVTQGAALGLEIEALTLANSILIILGAATLWGFTNHLGRSTDASPETPGPSTGEEESDEYEQGSADDLDVVGRLPSLVSVIRLVARISAISAPILALMGYYSASRFAFHPVVSSGAVIGVCVLLFYVVEELVNLVVVQGEGQAEARHSRIRLVPIVVGFLLFSAATPILALIWGADVTDLSEAWRIIADGIRIGDMVISPVDFLSFVLVFSVGYMVARIVQRVINRSVLPLTGLDVGGRAAVSTGVFYVGVVLAALIAISATGLDLSNLAIVAGALSVGIGFGLQNIVNNFVSGLILLIERPIKAGDWIEITSGMGYVKQINVRSTEIQTFDRAALIVPNSELISGPVTNWTHTNLNGRLKVPIGVAYGTDPKRVEVILTEIAKAHPMLLHRPAPYVLFLRFGADALEFEIRGVLRDVNWILNVTSDINFEISRRFAEEGIEIPFAQRDLHIRNADELGRSISKAMRGEEEPEAEAPKPAPSSPPRPAGPTEAAGNEPDGDT